MNNNLVRGLERERDLSRSAYFSDKYFSLIQLCSMSEQIHEIDALKPDSILEVGIGNGFTSTFLKRAGYRVTTVDINPSLEPDICAPLHEVAAHLKGATFDLVVCCEVLEHMPYESFCASIDQLRGLGKRLFLTLPNYFASFGFGGFLRLPKNPPKLIKKYIDIRRPKKLEGEHFWEVGSASVTSRKAIIGQLKSRYRTVEARKLALNPYHIAFVASD